MPQAPFRHPAWLIGPGLAAAGILLVMTVAGLAALFWQAPLPALAELWQQPYLRRVLTFTLWQATLSTLLGGKRLEVTEVEATERSGK
jgi:thiamine transport system permease protein